MTRDCHDRAKAAGLHITPYFDCACHPSGQQAPDTQGVLPLRPPPSTQIWPDASSTPTAATVAAKTGDALIRLAAETVAVFVRGLWLMLAVGVVHHQWIASFPTIGYGTAVAVAALLSAALIPAPTRNKTN